MVLCDCYKPDGTPLDGNTRKECAEVMEKVRCPESGSLLQSTTSNTAGDRLLDSFLARCQVNVVYVVVCRSRREWCVSHRVVFCPNLTPICPILRIETRPGEGPRAVVRY